MSEPSVFKFASVVVWVLLSGSRSTLPHPPVTGSTRFGTFPAAIRSPSGLPEIASPLMKRAAVNAEATVVSSLTVTVFGSVVPSTVISAIAGLLPPALLADGMPPLATRYRMASLPGAPAALSAKRPSAPVRACANCFGAPELAAHRVTIESAIGAPAPRTCPSMLTAGRGRTVCAAERPGFGTLESELNNSTIICPGIIKDVARNAASLFRTIYRFGFVYPDFCAKNIMVERETRAIAIIDIDSCVPVEMLLKPEKLKAGGQEEFWGLGISI